ncbi:MAG: Xaa-Pro peptidase family protein [Anaerolineales bacterium]
MKSTPYAKRQEKLTRILVDEGLDALALNPGPDLTYLTGLDFHLMERPVLGIFIPHQQPFFILPELEAGKLQNLPYPCRSYLYTEDRSTRAQAFQTAVREAGIEKGRIGVIPRRLRVLELRHLEQGTSSADFIDGQSAMSALRIIKDDQEVSAMQKAAEIAQRAFLATQSKIKPGITEKELASALVSQLLEQGSDPDLPFFPIVSFGANTANPHASPTDRILQDNQLLLVDWGATVDGYHSDITRTFKIGDVGEEFLHIATLVKSANQVGRDVVQPGTPCSEIDRRVREIIEEGGYGEYFIHRTGHGLGMEAHEEPYIAPDDDTLLEAGMTFTIEPGVYLPGKGGVRIEDDILVTEKGCRSFTDLPRALIPPR